MAVQHLVRGWLVMGVMVMIVIHGSAKTVRQADGIISIITELEPDKTPVAFLQAVEKPPGRATREEASARSAPPAEREVPRVVQHIDEYPLEEGQFKVQSAKIRVVDPETGLKIVHHGYVPEVDNSKEKGELIKGEQNAESKNFRSVRPIDESRNLDELRDRRPILFKEEFVPRNDVQKRKVGQYGYQTPRRDNTVRSEQTTRVRNNDGPTKIYKQTVVRPMTQEDEYRVSGRKQGKPGRYGRYRTMTDSSERTSPVRETISAVEEDRATLRTNNSPREIFNTKYAAVPTANVRENFRNGDQSRGKVKKEYSSRTNVKYPDGYAHENEERSESSSKYKTGVSTKKKPHFVTSSKKVNRQIEGKIPTSINDKLESDQPVQEASSLYSSNPFDGSYEGLTIDDHNRGRYEEYPRSRLIEHDGYGKEKHFEKEKGNDYIAAHNSAHGAKGEKGHTNEEAHSKGYNENHGHAEDKGYSSEKEGDEKSHVDKSAHFAAGHKAAEGEKGSDFHKEKGHRKGHKKSGFRTVVHKDEYKNKEEFYDEAHDSGEHKEHGHRHQHHGDKSGGHDEKKYLDSAHHQGSRGHEGGLEKGHGYSQHKGYNKDRGHEGHYGHQEEYGKKAGHKEGESHGHSEYGGYH